MTDIDYVILWVVSGIVFCCIGNVCIWVFEGRKGDFTVRHCMSGAIFSMILGPFVLVFLILTIIACAKVSKKMRAIADTAIFKGK